MADFPMQYGPGAKWPGEVLDGFGHAITGGAQQVVATIGGGVRQAGEMLQQGLDKPAEALNLKHSPFRVIDDPLKGATMSVENVVNRGVIDSVRIFWDSVTDGIDRIPDTFAPRDGRRGPQLPWDIARRM